LRAAASQGFKEKKKKGHWSDFLKSGGVGREGSGSSFRETELGWEEDYCRTNWGKIKKLPKEGGEKEFLYRHSPTY